MKRNVRMLARSLADAVPGNKYSFAELSKMAGIDVVKHRHVLSSACAIASRTGIVLKSVRGFGYVVEKPAPLQEKECGGYLILDILPMDKDNEGKKGLLVFYRDLDPHKADDKAIISAAPKDTETIRWLKGRKS